MSLTQRYGNWALVTGAARASGLGYAFARALAAEGMNVVLVDILGDELRQRTAELNEQYGIEARPVVLDLSQADFMPALAQQTEDIPIGLLVCNHMYTPKETPTILDMELALHLMDKVSPVCGLRVVVVCPTL